MCLIGLRIANDGEVLIAANRDEFASRPTQAMHWWDQTGDDSILAGKDLAAGGTWLGITRAGRFAAVTNVRDPMLRDAPIPFASRGLLVTEYLKGDMQPLAFVEWLQSEMPAPSPFNLLLGTVADHAAGLYWYGARTRQFTKLDAGVHVLSNAELNAPWPKAETLAAVLALGDPQQAQRALTSTAPADDHLLPDTGVGYAWEKKLSAAMITGDDYHTRSSTFISVRDGRVQAREITWASQGRALQEVRQTFELSHSSRLI